MDGGMTYFQWNMLKLVKKILHVEKNVTFSFQINNWTHVSSHLTCSSLYKEAEDNISGKKKIWHVDPAWKQRSSCRPISVLLLATALNEDSLLFFQTTIWWLTIFLILLLNLNKSDFTAATYTERSGLLQFFPAKVFLAFKHLFLFYHITNRNFNVFFGMWWQRPIQSGG